MDKIYILKRNRILLGPYTIAKLNERTVRSNDLVWYDGLPDWIEAEKIPELQTAISDDPIELPGTSKSFTQKIANFFTSRK